MRNGFEKFELWIAPTILLACVTLLAVMYGWVGTMKSIGAERREPVEPPETRLVANSTPYFPQGGQPLYGEQFPLGVGSTPGRLVGTTPIPMGIANSQMYLLDPHKTISGGIGGQSGQMKLNNFAIPAGIGSGQFQMTTAPPIYGGIGGNNGMIKLNNYPAPGGQGNNYLRLANGPTISGGIGGQSGQVRLNNFAVPVGIGNHQLQVTNAPIYSGFGGRDGMVQVAAQPPRKIPYLGVHLFEVEPGDAQAQGFPQATGVFVKEVVPASPAEKAGFLANDFIVKCDLKKITSLEQLNRILSSKKTGDVVKFVVERNGKKKSLHAKLAEGTTPLKAAAAHKTVWMGADIQDIDEVMRVQLKLPDKKGVIISQVAQDSPASAAGLRAGDVIERLGRTRVRNVQQFRSLLMKKRAGEGVSLVIFRDGKNSNFNLTLGQAPPASSKTLPPVPPAEMTVEGTWIGMDVAVLNPKEAANFGLPAGTHGIVVEDVESPPATTVGFQTGDIITAINGTPTLTMKEFVRASQGQSGAVVDIIRGKKHIFITVPPPGYTRQGTRINTGQGKFKQVAVTAPLQGTVAVFASSPSLNGLVSGEGTPMPYLILLNLQSNSFYVLNRPVVSQLPQIFRQNQVTALICSYASPNTISHLSSMGVAVYSGVVGTAREVFTLYQSGSLRATG